MHKIASLEAELSKLRTQIANYALNHVDMEGEQLQHCMYYILDMNGGCVCINMYFHTLSQ